MSEAWIDFLIFYGTMTVVVMIGSLCFLQMADRRYERRFTARLVFLSWAWPAFLVWAISLAVHHLWNTAEWRE